MKYASRSIYFALHSLLVLLARVVTGAPLSVTTPSTALYKRATEELTKGEKGGYVVSIILLVILSGITAGLTLGLMSLDETQLYVLSQSGSPKQKRHAAKIIPIRKNGHLLLVSLLLLNVIANETLPIISETVLGSGIVSVVISTAMIVIFSEILPQAICSTHGLAIGAAMVWPVKITIILMFVVAWPVAKLLDLLLGENHGMVYRRAELKELIDFHSMQAQHGGDLSIDAVTIMRGALDLQEKKVVNSMTYIDDVFMLHSKTKLDRQTIQRIVDSGHSRIPIYEEVDDEASVAEVASGEYSEVGQRRSIIGCLLAKNLLLVDPDDETPLSKVSINHIPSVQDDLPLFDILNIFQEGRSHLAIVVESPSVPLPSPNAARGSRSSSDTVVDTTTTPRLWTDEEMSRLEPIGIITLEDVLEELIQEPIWDETDTAQSRPRAGLAVPLNTGTGESLILATNRGRPMSRVTRGLGADEVSTPTSFRNELPKSQSNIEMVKLRAAAETGISEYAVSRSNSKVPADAKLPAASIDPFAEEYGALVARSSPSQVSLSHPNGRLLTNKHLSHIRPSRPLSLDMPLQAGVRLGGQVSATGPLKNRFKSRSTSSSKHSRPRRTQSAHNEPKRQDRSFSPALHGRGETFDYTRNPPQSARNPARRGEDSEDEGDPFNSMTMSAHEFGRR